MAKVILNSSDTLPRRSLLTKITKVKSDSVYADLEIPKNSANPLLNTTKIELQVAISQQTPAAFILQKVTPNSQ